MQQDTERCARSQEAAERCFEKNRGARRGGLGYGWVTERLGSPPRGVAGHREVQRASKRRGGRPRCSKPRSVPAHRVGGTETCSGTARAAPKNGGIERRGWLPKGAAGHREVQRVNRGHRECAGKPGALIGAASHRGMRQKSEATNGCCGPPEGTARCGCLPRGAATPRGALRPRGAATPSGSPKHQGTPSGEPGYWEAVVPPKG